MAWLIDPKLDLTLVFDDLKPPIDFEGQRSKVKVTGSKRSNFNFHSYTPY